MKQVSTPPLGVQILSVGFGPKLERAIGVYVPCQVRSTPLASGARSAVTRPAQRAASSTDDDQRGRSGTPVGQERQSRGAYVKSHGYRVSNGETAVNMSTSSGPHPSS